MATAIRRSIPVAAAGFALLAALLWGRMEGANTLLLDVGSEIFCPMIGGSRHQTGSLRVWANMPMYSKRLWLLVQNFNLATR
jgi:hypothetical protein